VAQVILRWLIQRKIVAIPKSTRKDRIEEIELYPFKKLISANVASIMVGHLHIPALDEKPSSISHKIITDILKKQLGYKGLIFTDALGMKGVADYADTAEVDLQAFLAGNDILLMSSDAIKGISKIKKAGYTCPSISHIKFKLIKIRVTKQHLCP